jgi:hypothetical protein
MTRSPWALQDPKASEPAILRAPVPRPVDPLYNLRPRSDPKRHQISGSVPHPVLQMPFTRDLALIM